MVETQTGNSEAHPTHPFCIDGRPWAEVPLLNSPAVFRGPDPACAESEDRENAG
jgi:hypothetical protein